MANLSPANSGDAQFYNDAVPPAPPGAPDVPVDAYKQPDPAAEKDLWSGRASWKAVMPAFIVWLLLTIVVCGAAWMFSSGSDSSTVAIALGVCGLLLLVILARKAINVWQTGYRLTTQRLFIRRGILSQTVDQTELIRVDDVKIRQSLLQRIIGIGDVEVFTSDRTDKAIALEDLDQPELVAEHLRRNTRFLQRRTVFMEQL